MLEWNEENGIRVFRLSSELFQHKTNPKVPDYTYDFALEHLKKIGDYAIEKGHRLTHPGWGQRFSIFGMPTDPQRFRISCRFIRYDGVAHDSLWLFMVVVFVIRANTEDGLSIENLINKNRLVLKLHESYSIHDTLRTMMATWYSLCI